MESQAMEVPLEVLGATMGVAMGVAEAKVTGAQNIKARQRS